MIGGMTGVTSDVIPFGFATGAIPAYLAGLNMVGLKRRGHSRDDMHRIRSAYRLLFLGTGTFAERAQDCRSRICRRSAGRKDPGFHPRQTAAPVDDGGGGTGRRKRRDMSAQRPDRGSNAGPLAVICGGGSLPIEVARAAQRQGRRVVLLALRGSADPARGGGLSASLDRASASSAAPAAMPRPKAAATS